MPIAQTIQGSNIKPIISIGPLKEPNMNNSKNKSSLVKKQNINKSTNKPDPLKEQNINKSTNKLSH